MKYKQKLNIFIGSVHWREEGCIGKYTPRGPRDFPKAGILHPEAREIARGRSPRAISRAEGCKIPAWGKSRGPRGVYFPMHPSSRQCTDILSSLSGKYWFFGMTTDGAAICQLLFEKNLLICNYTLFTNIKYLSFFLGINMVGSSFVSKSHPFHHGNFPPCRTVASCFS